MTRLRPYHIVLLLVALLHGQWAFATHEHALGGGAGEVCEVCLHASQAKGLPAPEFGLLTLPRAAGASGETTSVCIPRTPLRAAARDPPASLPL